MFSMQIIQLYFYLEFDNAVAVEAKHQLAFLEIAALNSDPTACGRQFEFRYGTRDRWPIASAVAVKKSDKEAR